MVRTTEELERLGQQYLDDKKKKKDKGVKKSRFSALSNSSRPSWIKGVACALVSTGEVAITAAVTVAEIQREVQHQKCIRAGKRLLANMEADGYLQVQENVS